MTDEHTQESTEVAIAVQECLELSKKLANARYRARGRYLHNRSDDEVVELWIHFHEQWSFQTSDRALEMMADDTLAEMDLRGLSIPDDARVKDANERLFKQVEAFEVWQAAVPGTPN